MAIKQMVSLQYSKQAYERRFAEITFVKREDFPEIKGSIITDELRNNILEVLLHWSDKSITTTETPYRDDIEEYATMLQDPDNLYDPDYTWENKDELREREMKQQELQHLKNFVKFFQPNFSIQTYIKQTYGYWSTEKEKEIKEWVTEQTGAMATSNTKLHVDKDNSVVVLNHITGDINRLKL